MRALFVLLFCAFSVLAQAQEKPANLDQLLEKVKQHQSAEKALYQQREQQFLKQRDQQKQLVENAHQRFNQMQKTNNPLQQKSDAYAQDIDRIRKELDEHVRDLGDIYSIYSEFSGDFIARMNDSLVSSQLPARAEQLAEMEQRSALPSIDDMRALMLVLQTEMTEAGKYARFESQITYADGSHHQADVSRVGVFSIAADQGLLLKVANSNELLVQQRQPAGYEKIARDFFNNKAKDGVLITVIDPTRGTLLGLLDQSPNLIERIHQGAEVGYVIMALGAAGLLLAVYRLLYLGMIWLKTQQQIRNIDKPLLNNPLGRVLQQGLLLKNADENTLQQRLNEAVLKELPSLEQGQSLIKLMAAIAPLLGLLGTVVGMIATFQSISLFGSGDPRLMAGGISQALVTTVQGLVVAIPLLFSHNLVSGFSRSLVQILDERSAGILANFLEQQAQRQSQHD